MLFQNIKDSFENINMDDILSLKEKKLNQKLQMQT